MFVSAVEVALPWDFACFVWMIITYKKYEPRPQTMFQIFTIVEFIILWCNGIYNIRITDHFAFLAQGFWLNKQQNLVKKNTEKKEKQKTAATTKKDILSLLKKSLLLHLNSWEGCR